MVLIFDAEVVLGKGIKWEDEEFRDERFILFYKV